MIRIETRFLAYSNGSFASPVVVGIFIAEGSIHACAAVSLVIEFLLENLIYVAKLNISKRLKTFELFVDYVRVILCDRELYR